MTVRQSAQKSYNIEIQEVTSSVRRVLDGYPLYKRTSERINALGNGIIFYTKIQPGIPLVLGTDMYIFLEPSGSQTLVSVKTESQVWIYGDVFGMYDRYIRTFFEQLEKDLRQVASGPAVQTISGGPIYRRTTSIASLVILGALLILYLPVFVIFIGPTISLLPSVESCFMLVSFIAIILIVLGAFVRALIDLRRPR